MTQQGEADGFAMSYISNYSSCSKPNQDPEALLKLTDYEKLSWREELSYAWCVGEEVMIDQMVLPVCFWGDHAELRKTIPLSPWVIYNPFWYLIVFSLMVCALPGHLFHDALGNGESLRSSEVEVETIARRQWIYMYSGSMLILAGIYVMTLFYRFFEGVLANYWDHNPAGYISALWVIVLYVGGDVHLLFQMRRRNTIMTHACVYGQVSWCVAFFIVLLLELLRAGHKDWSWTVNWNLVSWVHLSAASIFCFLMAFVLVGYTPLLGVHYEDRAISCPPHPWALWFSGFLAALGPMVALIVMSVWAGLGHFGYRPLFFLALPFVTTLFFLLVRNAIYGFAWERTWATLVALGPVIMVLGSFCVAGPHLWSFLSG